jgi:hypothetical protein
VASSEMLAVDCARSDDTAGVTGAISKEAPGRPRGARPIATASFAGGIRVARGLLAGRVVLPQAGLVASHVVAASDLGVSELT